MTRATPDQLTQLFELSNPANKAKAEEKAKEAVSDENKDEFVFEPLQPNITFDDFAKLDLRVAKIVNCTKVEKSKKLLQLTVDVGEGKTRNIFSGIANFYKPEDLIGKLTVIVANLEPRKMMGQFSEGMLLSASDGSEKTTGLYLLNPDCGAKPGMRLH